MERRAAARALGLLALRVLIPRLLIPRLLIPGLLISGLLLPSLASAQMGILTCVQVKGEQAAEGVDTAALKRLVETELDRHPSHTVAGPGEGCISTLVMEYIELPEAMGGARFLTGRINGSVPHREPIEGTVEVAVSRTLRILLYNDPIRLRGPAEGNFFKRALRTLRHEGATIYRVEIYQHSSMVDGEIESLPGLGLSARRELTRWALGARVGVAWRPEATGRALELRGAVSVEVEARWSASPKADTSLYLAPTLGLAYQRLSGPSPYLEGGRTTAYSQLGLAGGLRLGVEMFRITDTRLDLFTQATLPAFVTTDDDNAVVDGWIPSLSTGVGVTF